MNKRLIFGIIGIILIAGFSFYFLKTSDIYEPRNSISDVTDDGSSTSKYKNDIEKKFPFYVASESEIKNWEIYRNEKLGYSIKFPSSFEAAGGGNVDGIDIRSKMSIFYGVDIFPDVEKADTLGDFYKFAEVEYNPGGKVGVSPFYSLEKVSVNGEHGVLATYMEGDQDIFYRVLLYKENKIFNIEFRSKLSDQNILEKIVSTFQFGK